jgi:putative alpha-1,2-mannosidase
MMIGAPPSAHAKEPRFVANPARFVDTLVGTGSSASGGQINSFPGAAVAFGYGAVLAGDR